MFYKLQIDPWVFRDSPQLLFSEVDHTLGSFRDALKDHLEADLLRVVPREIFLIQNYPLGYVTHLAKATAGRSEAICVDESRKVLERQARVHQLGFENWIVSDRCILFCDRRFLFGRGRTCGRGWGWGNYHAIFRTVHCPLFAPARMLRGVVRRVGVGVRGGGGNLNVTALLTVQLLHEVAVKTVLDLQ